jgi:hypothetical protein
MDGMTMMSGNPFAGRLLSGEKIVWSGRPRQGLMLTRRDGLLIPVSLFWGGFAILWEWSVIHAPRAPAFLALFGIAFVLIGLFLMFGRFFLDAWVRADVFYALTESRILILRSRPWPRFQAISLDRLPEATLEEGPRGRGTIRFGPATTLANSRGAGMGFWMPVFDPTAQFVAIDDARRVFESIQERTHQGAR